MIEVTIQWHLLVGSENKDTSFNPYTLGYIFLYTLIVWGIGLPVPAVTHFETIHKQVKSYVQSNLILLFVFGRMKKK